MFTIRFSMITAVLCLVSIGYAAEKEAPSKASGDANTTWVICVPAYNALCRTTFFEAIDKAKSMGIRAIEGRPYKISNEIGDAQLAPAAPDAVLAKCRDRLKDAGIRMISYYAGDCGKNEAEMRKLFEFGKKMGVRTFIAEPKPESLPILDKLAAEFDINVAVHNHPRKAKNDKYVIWNPDDVMKMIAKCSPRIGCCADTGHWVRSNLDPLECLKKYQGRLMALHLKDVSEKGPKGKDAVFGTGVADVRAMLVELQRQKFSGQLTFENEANVADRAGDVAMCIEFVKKTAAELKQKVE